MWAHRVMGDYNRKAPKNAPHKQKARFKIQICGSCLQCVLSLSVKPCQKLAQRDASSLQDMFHLACFMNWLHPKMEIQLGKDSTILENIMGVWEIGNHGCITYKNGDWKNSATLSGVSHKGSPVVWILKSERLFSCCGFEGISVGKSQKVVGFPFAPHLCPSSVVFKIRTTLRLYFGVG